MVKYLEDRYDIQYVPVNRHGGILELLPGQDQFGYGEKITTDKVVVIGKHKYRVYCTCYSNAASNWIMRDGEKLFLREV